MSKTRLRTLLSCKYEVVDRTFDSNSKLVAIVPLGISSILASAPSIRAGSRTLFSICTD